MRRVWLLLLSVCLFAALRAEVPVFAYVVCGADGSQTAASFSDVTNYIERKTLQDIWGICLKDNLASIKVMEKCGFENVFIGEGDYQGEKCEIVKNIWKVE